MEIIFINLRSLVRERLLFVIMRTFIFLLCTTVFGFTPNNSFSQENITINADKVVSVNEVFRIIKNQTKYRFLYPEKLFEDSPKVELKKGNITLEKLLDQSLSKSNLNYKLTDKNVIVIVENIKREPILNQQQKIKITGVVVDQNNQPLPGANVLEKETNTAVHTDFEGKFSIQVANENSIVVVTYIGFITQEIPLKGQSNLIIKLVENADTLNEVTVVGYGTQSKTKITNSVSTLKSEDILSSPIASFEEGIAGLVAGVEIVQTSGDPGGSSDINIRGVGTLNANIQPLIVVDGFPSENFRINSMNPSDIESVDILKDAASASIYGSRGANGVILVTTKKGKKGGVKFTYDGYTGVQEVANTIDTQDAYERARYVAQGLINQGKAPLALYQPYLIGRPGLTNTNWQDEIFRIAPVQNSNITASGATNHIDYFVSGGYFNQEGIVLGSKYERINFRLNLNFDIFKNLKAGFNLAPTYSNINRISDADHKGDGVILTSLMANPLFSPYNSDGSLNLSGDMMRSAIVNGQAPVENPVALALLNTDKRIQRDFIGGTFLEFGPVKNITLKTYLGGDYSYSDRKSFNPNTVGSYSILVENKQAEAFKSFYERKNWMNENTAFYQKSFNNIHHLKFLIGQSYQTENIKTTGSNPLTADQTDINGVITTTFPLFEEEWTLLSYLSRLNYDYKDKYIFSGSIRRDGSSRFGENTKWGWFPSVSGAWRLSKEDFFNSKSINEFKLRASWGVTGNNGIPNYGAIPLLADSNYGDLDGLSPYTSPNQNLSWEQTDTFDIGLDVGLFNSKLSFTADYYNAITTGMLLDVPVPAHSGYSSSLRNIGKVQNSGFEFALNVNKVKLGYVKWSSTFNISTNKNEVLELGPDQERILFPYHITEVGKPMGSYYTYRKIGVFNSQEQIDNAPTHAEMRLGDYIFADLDGDGKITSNDKEISGDFFPDYTFGFSNTFKYKNFSFNFLIQGKQGYEVFNGTSFFIRNLEGWSNGHNDINDYYSATNPNATYASPGRHVKTYEQSDLFVEDASFIRLRKVSLKYSLPEKYLANLSLRELSIYMSATNLFTLTKYSGFNPEVSSNNNSFNNSQALTPGFDYGAYPIATTIVMGLNLSF
jgi:TonB-dependent starch-binding outer membrane protein SusC